MCQAIHISFVFRIVLNVQGSCVHFHKNLSTVVYIPVKTVKYLGFVLDLYLIRTPPEIDVILTIFSFTVNEPGEIKNLYSPILFFPTKCK